MPVTDVAERTGFPAILGHRVVTLHPKVHGGILADPDDPDHRRDLEEYGIEPIALVVVNLYPFARSPGVELIDVGGPAMVRAAAKNHAHVGVVVDPGRLRAGARRAARRRAAVRRRPAAGSPGPRSPAPRRTTPRSSPGSTARSPREEPATRIRCRRRCASTSNGRSRCATARTRTSGRRGTATSARPGWWDTATQHGGKALSYLNLLRHRGRVAARPPLRRAGLRDRQARQPVRRRRRRRHHHRVRAGQRLRSGQRVRRHRRPQPAGARRRSPRRWPRCSPRSSSPRRTTTTRWRRSPPRRNLRVLSAEPPGPPRARRAARSTAACSSRQPDPVDDRPVGVVGGHDRPSRRPSSGTTSSSPGRCAPP